MASGDEAEGTGQFRAGLPAADDSLVLPRLGTEAGPD